MSLKNVIYEFHVVGRSVKVSAIDPDTGTEVSIVGPPDATRRHLQNVALRKLMYVMEKARNQT